MCFNSPAPQQFQQSLGIPFQFPLTFPSYPPFFILFEEWKKCSSFQLKYKIEDELKKVNDEF